MVDFSTVYIEFSITTWILPTFRFWGGPDRSECKRVQVKAAAFKTLSFASQDQLPSRHYHVVLEESRLEEFYAEVMQLVLVGYENISNVQVNVHSVNRSSKIRDAKLTKVLGDIIFDMPELPNRGFPLTPPNRETILRAQKSGRLREYFQVRSAWFPQGQIPVYEYALSEYIGHTGRSESERLKGQELQCLVSFEDSSLDEIDYVFLTPPELWYLSEMGVEYHFYLITSEVESELAAELKRLSVKHVGFLKIEMLINLFDSFLAGIADRYLVDSGRLPSTDCFMFRYEYLASGQLAIKCRTGNLLFHSSKERAFGLPDKDRLDNTSDMYDEREAVIRLGSDSYSYSRKVEYYERGNNIIIDERSKEFVQR